MKNISFNQLHNQRKYFLNNNKAKDYAVVSGNNNIIISAPHGVHQTRDGKHKVAEIGSLATALYLQNKTQSFLIAKTQNNGDANYDKKSAYKQQLWDMAKKNQIKYVLDFHGLAAWREMDVNLGTNFGNNIQTNPALLKDLINLLEKSDFSVSVDIPFAGGEKTIAGHTKNKLKDVWTLQIEINSKITNDPQMIKRYNNLLQVLTQWINSLK